MAAGNATANGYLPDANGILTKQKNSNANAIVHLSGTFDGATVQVQKRADGDSTIGPDSDGWLDINGGAYTALDDDIINLPNQTYIRLKVSGVGTTSIDWDLN